MRTVRLSLTGTVILALLGVAASAVVARPESSVAVGLPIGLFEADAGGESVEFNADGSCRSAPETRSHHRARRPAID